MKKLLLVGIAGLALFTITTIVQAQDIGSEDIFANNVSIDLKVNGQDGPVTIEKGSRVVVSWVSDGATRCRGNWSRNDIKLSGTVSGKISHSVTIKAACIDADGNRDDDSVVVNVSGQAQIPTPSPVPQQPAPTTSAQPTVDAVTVWINNGSNSVNAGDGMTVHWKSSGLTSTIPMRIDLNDTAGVLATLASDIDNTGSRDVKIPTTAVAGSYYVSVATDFFSPRRDKTGPSASGRSQNFTITAPTTTTTQTTTSGNVQTGNVGTTVVSGPAQLSAAAPNISGERTPGGDKIYAGQITLSTVVQNSGGPIATPVPARFQYSTNGVNWYDFGADVGPISTTPKTVSYTWTGGAGSYSFRLCIGSGTDNCSPTTAIEIVAKEGALSGSQYGSVAVPPSGIWGFFKGLFGGR